MTLPDDHPFAEACWRLQDVLIEAGIADASLSLNLSEETCEIDSIWKAENVAHLTRLIELGLAVERDGRLSDLFAIWSRKADEG